MTRKDYILIAAALHKSRPEEGAKLDQWQDTVLAVSHALEDDNPLFARQRFLDYCNNGK